jgi:hypothetical protein
MKWPIDPRGHYTASAKSWAQMTPLFVLGWLTRFVVYKDSRH